jgi:acetyltransferase-like isoleucine patch superfamily enzyme
MDSAYWLKRGLDISSATRAKRLRFEAPAKLARGSAGNIVIGAWSYIQAGFEAWDNLRIGRYCSIGENFVTSPPSHPTHYLSTSTAQYHRHQFGFWMPEDLPLVEKRVIPNRRAEVVIGNDVWIGRDVTIMRGVSVGDGAILTSGAVVTKNVPPYAVVGGVPARLIKMRFEPDIVARMQQVRWWQYDRNEMRDVPFDDPVAALDAIERRVASGELTERPLRFRAFMRSSPAPRQDTKAPHSWLERQLVKLWKTWRNRRKR